MEVGEAEGVEAGDQSRGGSYVRTKQGMGNRELIGVISYYLLLLLLPFFPSLLDLFNHLPG